MSNDLKNILLKKIERELYNRSFFEFIKKAATVIEAGTSWDWNFHHEYICDILQNETYRILHKREKTKDIIINIPFRSSKSLIVSVFYPIWSWTINADLSFINLSFNESLTLDHSNKVIALLNSPWFRELYPEYILDKNQSSKSDFKLLSKCLIIYNDYTIDIEKKWNKKHKIKEEYCDLDVVFSEVKQSKISEHGGTRYSGSMSSVLGKGADIIILDDPNSPHLMSKIERQNVIYNWKNTVSTRLNNQKIGIYIIIQQRLHDEDLSGYLITNFQDRFNHIVLPAILAKQLSPSYLSDYYDNNLLWPTRLNNKVLNDFKITLGSTTFANQLMQSAVAEEGNYVKAAWLKTIENIEIPTITKYNVYIDSAYTSKATNDPTGIIITVMINGIMYVVDSYTKHYEIVELIQFLKDLNVKYKQPQFHIEPKASGLDIYNTLKREASIHITKLATPTTDKLARLIAQIPHLESGRVIIKEVGLYREIIEQLSCFPQVKHDEFVDLVAYACQNEFNKNNKINYLMI